MSEWAHDACYFQILQACKKNSKVFVCLLCSTNKNVHLLFLGVICNVNQSDFFQILHIKISIFYLLLLNTLEH